MRKLEQAEEIAPFESIFMRLREMREETRVQCVNQMELGFPDLPEPVVAGEGETQTALVSEMRGKKNPTPRLNDYTQMNLHLQGFKLPSIGCVKGDYIRHAQMRRHERGFALTSRSPGQLSVVR